MNDIKDKLIDILTGHSLDTYEDIQYVADELISKNVIPIIRCKDYKYWDGSVCDVHSEWPDQYSTGHMHYTEVDDFCSYGEPKEG